MVQLYLLNSFNLFQMVRYVFSTFSTSGHNTQGLCYDSNHKQVSTIHCWSYEPLQCVCLFVVRTNQDNGLKNFRVENDHAGAVSGMQICVVNHKPKLTTHFVFKTFHMLKPRHPRQQDQLKDLRIVLLHMNRPIFTQYFQQYPEVLCCFPALQTQTVGGAFSKRNLQRHETCKVANKNTTTATSYSLPIVNDCLEQNKLLSHMTKKYQKATRISPLN